MAELSRVLWLRHLRSEATSFVIHARSGHTVRAGRGLSFWFDPWAAAIAEVPLDDRELPILFAARTRDFQSVTAQGVLTWRVADAEKLAGRVDFAIDLDRGTWVHQPLLQLGNRLTELAQQLAYGWIGEATLERALEEGVPALRTLLFDGLRADPSLAEIGIEVASVRIASIRPDAEVERALQTPMRESMQQEADKATYERRAMAVERERAIAENELHNKIALAKREEELVAQRGANERKRVTEEAAALRIGAEATAERARIEAEAEAKRIREVETAKNEAETVKIAIYRDLPPHVIAGIAAHHLADNLPAIEHLTISPDLLGPALSRLAASSHT